MPIKSVFPVVSLFLVLLASCIDPSAGGARVSQDTHGEGDIREREDVREEPDSSAEDTGDTREPGIETVYVSAQNGDDSELGVAPQKPVKSLQRALEVARAQGARTIALAGGDYLGPIELPEGVSIYGGFAQDFNTDAPRDQKTRILAQDVDFNVDKNAYITVLAEGIQEKAVIDGVEIQGQKASRKGASTIAVMALNSPELRIEGVTIVAADASDGRDGVEGRDGAGGRRGAAGRSGLQISEGLEFSEEDEGNEESECVRGRGGSGGKVNSQIKPCEDVDESQAAGGEKGCGAFGDYQGAGGEGGANRCGSENIGDLNGGDGPSVAGAGPSSFPGMIAESTDIGFFDADGVWVEPVGLRPQDGNSGAGGAGGGAGGSYQLEQGGEVALGGDAGGGGGGGKGGGAGQNGGAGGSSFGLVIVGSPIALGELSVELGRGGHGGQGSVGGRGGKGGEGGEGGVGASARLGNANEDGESYAGGTGGSGGQGGDGGDGAGGRGGNSIGVAAVGVEVEQSAVTFESSNAASGEGGRGSSEDADDGYSGELSEAYYFELDSD